MRRTFLAAIAALAFIPHTSQAQQPTADTGTLQKEAQNPVAGLISVPIQNNTNFGIGPFGRNQNVLNIQPVVPVNVSHDWNLIIRWITPIVWQPAPGTANLEVYGIEENTPAYFAATDVQAHAGVFGFGDMTPTFFMSLVKPHKVIWATGPMFTLPTDTGKVLGQGKLSMGPSIVALAQPGHWTVGALVNNIWSVAGPSDRADVNQMSLQYFLNYNLQKGWSLSMSTTPPTKAGFERKCVDSTRGRRSGASFPIGIPASKCIGFVLRECCASGGRVAVGDEAATIVLVSEETRRREEEIDSFDA
jgi:hypothetical protein